MTIAIISMVLALGWLPIARRFQLGWRVRRNPVSLAICAAILLFSYTNVLFAFALMEQTTWQFFAIATHIFDVIVLINFYVSFRWSDKRFKDARQGDSIPAPNSSNTRR